MTTTVRSVRVELEMGIAGYVANAKIAGRETDKAFGSAEDRISATSLAVSRLEKNTANLTKTTGQAQVSQSGLGREIEKSGRSAGTAERSIDKYSGRLRVLTDIAVIGGPALLRLGAGALPLVSAGMIGIGAAAGGIGVAALALHGLSDSIKAIDAYRLDPTAKNLELMRVELAKAGPAGAEFARYIANLEPDVRKLQNVARAGIFPGLEDGIDAFLTRGPQVTRIISDLSDGVGDLARQAGEGLSSDEWTPFFDYIESDARPTLDAFAHSTGNVALGVANLLVAFAPLSRDFTGGLEDATGAFADWSKQLDDDEGFQSFLDTVEDAGPELLDFLGSVVQLAAGLAQASSVVGSATLPPLTALVKVLAAIAKSDAGPALYATAAGLIAFNRASALTVGLGPKLSKTFEGLTAAKIGQSAAALGLLALSMSDLDDKAGMTNTTMGAFAGTVVGGPWGFAIGAAVGQILDFKAAYQQANDAIADADQALRDNDTNALLKERADLVAQLAKEHPDDGTLGNYFDAVRGSFHDFAGQSDDFKDRIAEIDTALANGGDVADLFGETIGQTGDQLRTAASSADEFSGALARLNGWFDKRDAVRAYKDSLDGLTKGLKDGFSREDSANIDAVGRSILQVAQDIKNPQARSGFLADARSQLVDMAQHSGPKAAAAIQEVIDKFDDKGLTSPPVVKPKVDTSDAEAKVDKLKSKTKTDFDIMDALSANPKIDANDNPFRANYKHVRGDLTSLDAFSAKPTVDTDTAPARHKVSDFRGYLADLDKANATPKVTVNAGNSISLLDRVAALLGSLHDRTITVTTNQRGGVTSSAGGRSVPAGADGMTVPGARHPYGDKVLAHLAPGEEVISNRHGQADRFRSDRASGRIPGYADGGTVADRIAATYTRRSGETGDTAHHLDTVFHNLAETGDYVTHGLKGLKAAADKVSDSYDKQKSKLDDLLSQRASTASSIASAALHDPFGNGLAGLNAQVDADTNDLDAMTAALATLVKNGLDPKSALYQQLAAHMDLNTAQQLAQLSSGDLQGEAVRFQHRADEAATLGNTVAGQEFNAAIREQTKATRELQATLKDLKTEIRQMGDHVKNGAKAGTEHVGDSVFVAVKDANEGRQRRTATTVRTNGGRGR